MYKTSIHTNITKLNSNSRLIKFFLGRFLKIFFIFHPVKLTKTYKRKEKTFFFLDSNLRLFRVSSERVLPEGCRGPSQCLGNLSCSFLGTHDRLILPVSPLYIV